jgi:acetamidase/formamidase
MKRITRDRYGYAFDASLPPVIEVDPGEAFWVETNDAHRGTVTDEGAVYADLDDAVSRLGGANPVSGPVALHGARPGDCLAVTVERIDPAPRVGSGYTCTTARVEPSLSPESVLCPVDDGAFVLPTAAGALRLPLAPMLGTLGFAPAGAARPSFGQAADSLGNLDLPQLSAGATVVMRSQVDGGLLFVGDAHLAQGDAEINRAAIEAEADVRLSMRTLAPEEAALALLPQLNTDAFMGSIAPGPGSLDDLVRAGYADLAQRLTRFHGLSLADAYRVLGAAGRITVGQLVPPLACVLAWLPRDLVAPIRMD